MLTVKTILLGMVQGLTEFLPVSSSAHLVIFQQWLSLSKEGPFLLAFDVALHFGTLAAVVLYFWPDLKNVFSSVKNPSADEGQGRKLALFLILGTIPAGVVGMIFKDFFESLFADIIPSSFFLLITGCILWLTKFVQFSTVDLTTMKARHAWLIGAAQAVSILPGISRSGSTIAMGLFLRLTPAAAVRFSFLLAIPAILGASIFELPTLAVLQWNVLLPVFLGMITSFAFGYLSISWMLQFIGTHKLHYFAWYCWGLGSLVLITEFVF